MPLEEYNARSTKIMGIFIMMAGIRHRNSGIDVSPAQDLFDEPAAERLNARDVLNLLHVDPPAGLHP